jgi:hypothetical protein
VNTLALIPGGKSLRYAGFANGRETCTGTIRGFRWQGSRVALDEVRAIAQAVGLLDDATRCSRVFRSLRFVLGRGRTVCLAALGTRRRTWPPRRGMDNFRQAAGSGFGGHGDCELKASCLEAEGGEDWLN